MFGSFYRGYYVLKELLHGPISKIVEVVGVATDDPGERFNSPDKRVWQYPHTPYEEVMVKILAEKSDIEVFRGRVNTDSFYQQFESKWRPEICILATFGQRIGLRLINTPKYGFYNLHPCIDDKWPSQYVGGNPFDALIRDKKGYTCIAFHAVDEGFDTGPLIALSEKIHIPQEATVVDMHKITSVAAARLAARELTRVIEGCIERV
jgi:methionyl-tRNA formyltransferase